MTVLLCKVEVVTWHSLANCILGTDRFVYQVQIDPPPTSMIGGGEEALKAVRYFTTNH